MSELRISATINQALGALVFEGLTQEIRPFVKQYLLSRYVEMRRQAAGGMQPNLNLGLVKQNRVALPPLGEQSFIVLEVAEKISQIETTEAAIEIDLLRAARLRQSILKQAFEGKLVPQDPADEPAAVLLERIKDQRSEPERKTRKPRTERTLFPS